jgi:putative oxidoreductase
MANLHEIAENQPATRFDTAEGQSAGTARPRGRFESVLASLAAPAYALLRVITGLLFAFHGMQGLTGYQIPAEFVPKVGSQGWIGSLIELATGLLMAGGFLTRWAAFLASGTMAVAYVQFHWKFQFGPQFFPTLNQGEMALVYCLLFFCFATRGPGRFSVDGMLGR